MTAIIAAATISLIFAVSLFINSSSDSFAAAEALAEFDSVMSAM